MGPEDPGQRRWVPRSHRNYGPLQSGYSKSPNPSCLPSAPGASWHEPVMALPQKEAKGSWKKRALGNSLQAWVVTATCKRHSDTRSPLLTKPLAL